MLSQMEMARATIKDLQIQPIKGGGALKLEQALMTPAGLKTVDGQIKDHSLFVVEANPDPKGYHHFLTQRTQVDPDKNLYIKGDPRLSLIQPGINQDNRLVFKFDGHDEVVDLGKYNGVPKKDLLVQLWEYYGGAIEVPLLSEWLSDNLNRAVKVGRTNGRWDRLARQNFVPNDNPLRAQDGYPVHAVVREDTAAIFKAINQPVDSNRFRYQVLLEGLRFRQIHDFSKAEINGGEILQAEPSDRCEVTGIDQIVGENWLPQAESLIRVGDTVRFTERRLIPLQFEAN